MRFGLMYHHQLPRPWAEGSEEQLYNNALDQIELADKLGYDYVWESEHHFLEEYSHSSAPEIFLAAAAARTQRIRLAHGIVTVPPAVNQSARVAERIAMLDLISGGRVDFGTGEGSSQLELDGFGVARETKREQWDEAVRVITRMMTEVPFTGHQGTWTDVPPRNVVPKPKQKPHPPMWVACSARKTIELAARSGLGALSFSFVSPSEAKQWVDTYYDLIQSDECVPIGKNVNPNFAVVLPFMCHPDEEVALDRGLDGAHFVTYSLMHYYVFGQHRPGTTNVWEEFQQNRAQFGFTREPVEMDMANQSEDAKLMLEQITSLRRGIGTPDKIAKIVREYEEVGVDQVILMPQIGKNKHEHVCESLELFAREVMPEFTERREARETAKQERLSVAVKEAMTRIPENTTDVSDYVVGPEIQG